MERIYRIGRLLQIHLQGYQERHIASHGLEAFLNAITLVVITSTMIILESPGGCCGMLLTQIGRRYVTLKSFDDAVLFLI